MSEMPSSASAMTNTSHLTAPAQPVSTPAQAASSVCQTPEYNRFGIFAECPHCGGSMSPEHAHYRCGSCGWRDSCCD